MSIKTATVVKIALPVLILLKTTRYSNIYNPQSNRSTKDQCFTITNPSYETWMNKQCVLQLSS